MRATTGDLIQRCTSDVETIRRFLSVQIMEVVNTLLLVTLSLIILLGKNVSITLYSMVLVPALFLFAMWFFRKVHKGFRVMDEAEGKMSAVLQENLSGVRVVRAFGQQQREVEKFDAASSDFRKKAKHLNDLLAVYWGGGDALSMLQSMVTLLICVIYASRGEITVGTLIIFTTYVGQLLFPIRQLGRTLSDAGKSLVSMERIQEILSAPAEPEEPNALKPDLHGDIVFDHVTFAYDQDAPVLKDVSFTIPAGKTVAVLGGTGSGKSTLMYLLQRLYEPTSGTISIGGVPLSQIDREYLRSHVGLILQEPFLYSKSIRDNVGIPIELALAAVDERLRQEGIRSTVSLVASGTLRNAADVVRAVALGADAVSIGSAALIAMGCHQCGDCASGRCNWGIATQRADLVARRHPEAAPQRASAANAPARVARLTPEAAAERVVNLASGWNHEIQEMMGGMGINAIDSLRGNRLMLRGVGLNEKELEILGVKYAGE